MEPTAVVAPPVEGLPEGTGSQATPPVPQGTAEPQETVTNGVEVSQTQEPSNPRTERPKPSEFYGFRKENQRLREELQALKAQQNELLQKFNSSAPKAKQLPDYLQPEKFWENSPENLLRLKEEAKQEAAEEFKKSFPELYKQVRESEQMQSKALEAMELILPKDNSGKSLEQRYDENIEKVKRVEAIIDEQGLKFIPDPIQKVKLALRIYEDEIKAQQPKRPANPNAIDKKLMGGVPAAQPVGGGKKMPTLAEARAEFNRLAKMRDENPEMRFDENFNLQMTNAKKTLQDLVVKEQGGINQ